MFLKAMQQFFEYNPTTTTANNAKSYVYIDPSLEYEGRLGLFTKSVRGVDNNVFEQYLLKSFQEDKKATVILSFFIRDCRGGKGERALGRKCLEFLHQHCPELLPYSKIAEYGRWDDLVLLNTTATDSIIVNRLRQDVQLMLQKQPVSLCAKWFPSEGHKLDTNGLYRRIAKLFGLTPRLFRKTVLTPLRTYIDIVEKHLCEKTVQSIDYSKVPSCAMHKLSKCFQRLDPVRFTAWKEGLVNGKTKVNATQLFPHEIIVKYMSMSIPAYDSLLEAQWKVVVENASCLLRDSLVVCDVSGSMFSKMKDTAKPIHVSIGLGILIAQVTQPPFKGNLITFSNNPELVSIQGLTLHQAVQKIKNMPWGMNTDLQKTLDLILDTTVKTGVKYAPKTLFIISDMQFDWARGVTNLEAIKAKYHAHELTMPNIIFWNVNGSNDDTPTQIHDTGVVLLSGFSPSLLKLVSESDDISAVGMLNHVLESERYRGLV